MPHLRFRDGSDLVPPSFPRPLGRCRARRKRLRLHGQLPARPREVRRRLGLLRHGRPRGRRGGARRAPGGRGRAPRIAREPDAPPRGHRGDLAPDGGARHRPHRRQHVLLALSSAAVSPRRGLRRPLAHEVRERPFDLRGRRRPRAVPVHEGDSLPLVQGPGRDPVAVRLVAELDDGAKPRAPGSRPSRRPQRRSRRS